LSKSGQLQKQQNLANSIISYLSLDCINNLRIPVLSVEKQEIIGQKYKNYVEMEYKSKQLFQEAKNYVEDLIEGSFSMKK
jgi:type I restriction enzyme S subunit